jgi:hypothetical protein
MDGHDIGHVLSERHQVQSIKKNLAPGDSDRGVCRDFSLCRRIDGSPASVRHKNPTQIADQWAIGWDRVQWILLRAEKQSPTARWRGVSFVSSTRDILCRCVAENKCIPNSAGEVFFRSLPHRFRDFISGAILGKEDMVL